MMMMIMMMVLIMTDERDDEDKWGQGGFEQASDLLSTLNQDHKVCKLAYLKYFEDVTKDQDNEGCQCNIWSIYQYMYPYIHDIQISYPYPCP